jgi:hypothetical protein
MIDECLQKEGVCPAVCEHRTACAQCGRLLCHPSANRRVKFDGHFYRDNRSWCMRCYERLFGTLKKGLPAVEEIST